MDKFAKRLIKRENAIKDWLTKNNLDFVLNKADQILNNLPKETIKASFKSEIERALQHCIENNKIKALDFQWYYGGREIGGALAYGIDSCKTKGSLSKTDLGPEELPGIEINLKHGNLVDHSFAEIPVSIAINKMVKEIKPLLKESEEIGGLFKNTSYVITDYFQIWNYKIGHEVCDELRESDTEKALKNRAPFWITMTRQERWSVPIMLID